MVTKVTLAAAVAALLALTVAAQTSGPSQQEKPFGGATDAAFANKLWKATDGYEAWKLTTEVYPGKSPHGKWLRLFSTWVTVDGKSYPIIGSSMSRSSSSRRRVTVAGTRRASPAPRPDRSKRHRLRPCTFLARLVAISVRPCQPGNFPVSSSGCS